MTRQRGIKIANIIKLLINLPVNWEIILNCLDWPNVITRVKSESGRQKRSQCQSDLM